MKFKSCNGLSNCIIIEVGRINQNFDIMIYFIRNRETLGPIFFNF